MAIAAGRVFWITGLSGAGKSTVGRLLFGLLRASHANIVFLDGDVLREVFGDDLGHSHEDRMKSAMRNARLCKMLAEQGIDVVCATISLFRECQEWNRNNIRRYHEIFLSVPMQVLVERDQKALYSRALRGKIKDVMGIDIPIEEPENPDLVLVSDGTISPDVLARQIWEKFATQPEGT